MPNEKKPESTYDRFQRLVRRVVSVPKREADRREAQWKKRRGKSSPKAP